MQKFYCEIYFFTSDDNGSVIIKFLHITVYVGNKKSFLCRLHYSKLQYYLSFLVLVT